MSALPVQPAFANRSCSLKCAQPLGLTHTAIGSSSVSWLQQQLCMHTVSAVQAALQSSALQLLQRVHIVWPAISQGLAQAWL